MNTIATSLPVAADFAAFVSLSLLATVTVVPSLDARVRIAESGSMRYGKSTVPEPQPIARTPVLQPRSEQALGPEGLAAAWLPMKKLGYAREQDSSDIPMTAILAGLARGSALFVFFRRTVDAAPIWRMSL